ncbi:MAG: ABC transporter [Clostridiales bacterium]|jgi:simple sugar transport system permease protein|nr:ABC transporter [Clostridiales bacterium]
MEILKKAYEGIGLTRFIITLFLIFLIIMSVAFGIDSEMLLSDCLTRIGMNGLFVLSMLLPVVAGAGINFAMPIGVICGLVGGVISLEYEIAGFAGLMTAIAIALPLAALGGYVYSLLLNRVRGSEMMVGNFTALATVALMSLAWMFFPVTNRKIVWPMLGYGVRMTLTLDGSYENILDDFLAIHFSDKLIIPTGLFIVFLLMCFAIKMFLNTKTGISMQTAGSNPSFAKSIGININKMRSLSLIISCCLSAVGIIVYSQSYGFYQFYNAPQNMTIPTIASILIGGATMKKANVTNVIIGTILFQSILTIAMPVSNVAVASGGLSEVVRVIVCNGIILYALTKSGGDK